MIIYSVTVKVDLSIHDEWFSWMQEKHIPDVINTGYFTKYKMFRLMEEQQEDGITYTIQYWAESFSDIQNYTKNAAPALQKEHTDKYKGHFVAFRTLLRSV
mgnify:CR=1 FL=1